MLGPALSRVYKAEKGLQEVLCNLDGSYRSLDEMATRVKLAMDKVRREASKGGGYIRIKAVVYQTWSTCVGPT